MTSEELATVFKLNDEVIALRTVAEATAPFALLLQDHHDDKRDDEPLFGVNGKYITYGDLRKLNAALAKVKAL